METKDYIIRNSKRVIDAHKSIHAFAMALGREVAEEARLRDNKAYKKVIRSIFRRYPGLTINVPAVIAMACSELVVLPETYQKTVNELRDHMRLNNGGYLSITKGKNGGVRLISKARKP